MFNYYATTYAYIEKTSGLIHDIKILMAIIFGSLSLNFCIPAFFIVQKNMSFRRTTAVIALCVVSLIFIVTPVLLTFVVFGQGKENVEGYRWFIDMFLRSYPSW